MEEPWRSIGRALEEHRGGALKEHGRSIGGAGEEQWMSIGGEFEGHGGRVGGLAEDRRMVGGCADRCSIDAR